jgi:hypothetical protein
VLPIVGPHPLPPCSSGGKLFDSRLRNFTLLVYGKKHATPDNVRLRRLFAFFSLFHFSEPLQQQISQELTRKIQFPLATTTYPLNHNSVRFLLK